MTGRLQQYHSSQDSRSDRRKTRFGQRKLIKILPSYGSFLKEGRRARWQRLLPSTFMMLTHDRFQRRPARQHLPMGGGALAPQQGLPGKETSLSCLGEIPLSQKRCLPFRVYFNMKRAKKKKKKGKKQRNKQKKPRRKPS